MEYKPARLFFDIESCANVEALTLMPEPKAPGNLKDPEKIKAAIEEKRRELIENAALDADYGKVLSIGYSISPSKTIEVLVVGDPYVGWDTISDTPIDTVLSESDILTMFWGSFARCNGYAIGYNILGFDLPYLLRRSMYLGVKVPMLPNLSRYHTEPVTDLMMCLCNWDTYKAKGLKQMARLLGIPNNCPDVDGSKVKDLTPEQLREYQMSDVRLTIALYERMNGIYFSH